MADERAQRGEGRVEGEGRLGGGTRLGAVRLRVADLERVAAFYEVGVGLARLPSRAGEVVLGSRGEPVVQLVSAPDLQPPPPGSAGLYHTAILFDDRAALAGALYAAATRTGGTFTGSADHLVSLAFYFDDPEGNGVELYWDRPRSEWRWEAGQVVMDSLPLDPNGFIREHHRGEGEPAAPTGAAARLGHVHLKVGDVEAAKEFYVDRVGFEVTTAMWQSALFASAGGYHHHLGMNVWESRGASLREPSLGLESFEVVVGADDLSGIERRLAGALSRDDEGLMTAADPWGTRVSFRAEGAEARVEP